MSLGPLLDDTVMVQLHVALSLLAMAMGFFQLGSPKSGFAHRLRGYSFVILMGSVAISALFINELRVFGPWSPLHLLSVLVLVMVPLGIYSARTGNIRRHKRTMLGLFFGGLILAGVLAFLPGRVLHSVYFSG